MSEKKSSSRFYRKLFICPGRKSDGSLAIRLSSPIEFFVHMEVELEVLKKGRIHARPICSKACGQDLKDCSYGGKCHHNFDYPETPRELIHCEVLRIIDDIIQGKIGTSKYWIIPRDPKHPETVDLSKKIKSKEGDGPLIVRAHSGKQAIGFYVVKICKVSTTSRRKALMRQYFAVLVP